MLRITSLKQNAIKVRADVRLHREVKKLIKTTLREYGKIDILVNNAGVGVRKTLLETSGEEWDEVIDTNLKGGAVGDAGEGEGHYSEHRLQVRGRGLDPITSERGR